MKDKLLQAKGKKLSLLLGEALQQTHEPMLYGPYDDPPSTSISCRYCFVCVHNEYGCRISENQRKKFFSQTCLISIKDWNVAMKWRDWAIEKYGVSTFGNKLHDVMEVLGLIDGIGWELLATKEHYLIAAALCKLEG
jgi:hypothetical protein